MIFESTSKTLSLSLLCKETRICNSIAQETETNNSNSATANNSNSATANNSTSLFIDPTDLKTRLAKLKDQANKKSRNFLIIFLDCRPFSDFNSKRIKDSIHVNCRDKLSKRRLMSRKITVKDMLNSENGNVKLDLNNNATNGSTVNSNDEDLIIIYDDKTSDANDLQSEFNPLKIVSDNIKQTGCIKDCKILKGGFSKFSDLCPEYVEEVRNMNSANSKYYEIQTDQNQSSIDNAIMTKIEPYIYLGNESDAKNLPQLESNGIRYILNVTKNIPFYGDSRQSETACAKFIYKRISVNDGSNQNLKQHFDDAFQFIDEAMQNNSKVLVHCQAGVSRSPTIVIAYLMHKYKIKMNDAYNRVRELRPIVAPNFIFMSQLFDFEANMFSSTHQVVPQKPLNISNFSSTFNFCSDSVNRNLSIADGVLFRQIRQ